MRGEDVNAHLILMIIATDRAGEEGKGVMAIPKAQLRFVRIGESVTLTENSTTPGAEAHLFPIIVIGREREKEREVLLEGPLAQLEDLEERSMTAAKGETTAKVVTWTESPMSVIGEPRRLPIAPGRGKDGATGAALT